VTTSITPSHSVERASPTRRERGSRGCEGTPIFCLRGERSPALFYGWEDLAVLAVQDAPGRGCCCLASSRHDAFSLADGRADITSPVFPLFESPRLQLPLLSVSELQSPLCWTSQGARLRRGWLLDLPERVLSRSCCALFDISSFDWGLPPLVFLNFDALTTVTQ